MATHSGQDGVIKIGAVTVGEVKSFSIEETGETLEDTAQGDDWRTHKGGLKSWSGSIEAHWDPDDTGGQDLLVVGASITGIFHPFGAATGAATLTGVGTIVSRSISSELEGIVSVSFSVTGNGALTQSEVGA